MKVKNKNRFFELFHTEHYVKLYPQTMSYILHNWDYVLVRNRVVYVKNCWYEYWVKIPVKKVMKK